MLKRNTYTHTNLLAELRAAPKDWKNYLRMNEDTYMNLLSLVTPLIEKEDTVMRCAISPHERLTATLTFELIFHMPHFFCHSYDTLCS